MKDPAGTLLVIGLVAFSAPLLTSLAPWLRLPALVIEILLGIVVGPQVLDIVEVTEPISFLSEIGLATLMFLAGSEIDPDRVKGPPLKLATSGWVLSVGLGLGLGFALHAAGIIVNEMYVGLALTTTALGTLLPILRDAGILRSPFGTHMLAVGSVGEFGPILAVAILLGASGAVQSVESLVIFAVLAAVALYLATRKAPLKIQIAFAATLRSSGQLYIRLAMALIALLTWAAGELGLDVLLGAFTAGLVFRLFAAAGSTHEEMEVVEAKLEGLCLGYLIPIFFVVTGINYDLESLTGSPTALAKVPLFLGLMLVVRGVPALLYKKELPDPQERWALAFLSATGLPLIVAITHIGVAADQMRTSTAAALVGAGMISVVVFPLVGKSFLDRALTAREGRGGMPGPVGAVEAEERGSGA